MDLFSFRYQGKILAFADSSSDPVSATVKDNAAETTALNWAVRFYSAQDIDREEIELRTAPTLFWLVRLRANVGASHKMLYAVVLPNGSIVPSLNRQSRAAEQSAADFLNSQHRSWADKAHKHSISRGRWHFGTDRQLVLRLRITASRPAIVRLSSDSIDSPFGFEVAIVLEDGPLWQKLKRLYIDCAGFLKI